MLNLKICRLCHEQNDGVIKQWSRREEVVVKNTRFLACPYVFQGVYEAVTPMDELPPPHCPFSAEHAVLA
jgi:hypothetical protein